MHNILDIFRLYNTWLQFFWWFVKTLKAYFLLSEYSYCYFPLCEREIHQEAGLKVLELNVKEGQHNWAGVGSGLSGSHWSTREMGHVQLQLLDQAW